MVEDILAQDAEAVKEHVEENLHDADLKEMVAVEEENADRDNLVLWLLRKHKRKQLLTDEELVEDMLSHIEEAYRTAAISEDAYREAKQANRDLLENN